MKIDDNAAVRTFLAKHHMELTNTVHNASGKIGVTGQIWSKVSVPGVPALQDIHVAVPISGLLTVTSGGLVQSLSSLQPAADDIAEAVTYVESLAKHGQIEGLDVGPASRPTHRIETSTDGLRRLVRLGFSAV